MPSSDRVLCFGFPAQARQLESLIRLAEARARADLRQVVTQADAEVRDLWAAHAMA